MIQTLWPPLGSLWPHLGTCSAPQAAFLALDQLEAFYGGSAGGGKSDALLAGALQYVDKPRYSALILRRTFADLNIQGAAMNRAQEWLAGKAHWQGQDKKFTFPSGATLTFGYLQTDADMYRYQSAEFQYIAFDELTQFSERQYEYLFSRLRGAEDIPVPLRMRAGSNPGGIGHGWVKRRFITGRAEGVVYIPARLSDHPDESFKRGYRQSLAKLDDVTRRQYEDGDWDVAAGLAFHVIPGVHLVVDIDIPAAWNRFEAMDFGVANPTCVGMFGIDHDSNIVLFDSYYQGDTLTSDHARAIEAKRQVWWPTDVNPVNYADPSMWARKGHVNRWGDPATDVTEFLEHGIGGLVQANNERRAGRIRVAELLKPDPDRLFPSWHPLAGQTGAPRFFINSARCLEIVEQLQAAPLLPIESGKQGAGEIVDPEWESQHGHAVAMVRYGAMSRPSPSDRPPPENPHLIPPEAPEELKRAWLLKVEADRNRESSSRPYVTV